MDPFVKQELPDFIDQENPTLTNQTHTSLPPLHQSDPNPQTTNFDSAATELSGFGCFDSILNSPLQDFFPYSEIADFIKQENPSSLIPNHQPDLGFSVGDQTGKRVSDGTNGDSTKKRKVSKQFWKAGDYEDSQNVGPGNSSVGMDHVRVHPKFLHSNATSHKWALGAFAELLDNSLDEVCYGATFVNVDVLQNNKDMSRMLLIEDDGGGMTPDKMRSCMSLGYSAKSKLANVIGQYGNGFKTSTMRLGADVIVFSRSCSGTQSIGMLSYTFLKGTGKEDIVVPILDFEKGENGWNKLIRSTLHDWDRNAKVIVQWSPYSSEDDLFDQFNLMSDHGTRVIIYNLWEDDEGELELDFLADPHDIQIRGGNRDDNLKKIETVKEFSTSSLILSYRHSLRSYASILYLRLPPAFQILLRGKVVEHHNIVNDLMLMEKITYRPKPDADRVGKDRNMVTTVMIGFVKDAKDHRDVQGFNVYHKNRLIKPFWRLWNAAGIEGRGSIAVLEANFVEPAHDKQGFERTALLQRLEQRLLDMQKTYWYSQCQKIGYAPRQRQNKPWIGSAARDSDIRTTTFKPIQNESACEASFNEKSYQRTIPHVSQSSSRNSDNGGVKQAHASNGNTEQILTYTPIKAVDGPCNEKTLTSYINLSALNYAKVQNWKLQYRLRTLPESYRGYLELEREKSRSLQSQLYVQIASESDGRNPTQLRMENLELKKNLKKMEESFSHDLDAERHQCTSLEAKLKESEMKIEEINGKQESLIDMFAEERNRRDNEQANLRMKLKDASSTIDSLLDKVRWLENIKQE